MKKTFLKQSLLVGVALLGLSSAIPAFAQALPVSAREARTSERERQEPAETETETHTEAEVSTRERQEPAETETETHTETRKEAAKTRLADAKLKACQNREKAITNIMTRLGDRGQKQANLFGTIAERTQKHYANKGKTLANYDVLVADVVAKKAAAQTAIDAVKSTTVEFECDGDNPKGLASSFKDSLKAEIAALKDFKTAVKNLIVGVKSVQSTTSSDDDGGTN